MQNLQNIYYARIINLKKLCNFVAENLEINI